VKKACVSHLLAHAAVAISVKVDEQASQRGAHRGVHALLDLGLGHRVQLLLEAFCGRQGLCVEARRGRRHGVGPAHAVVQLLVTAREIRQWLVEIRGCAAFVRARLVAKCVLVLRGRAVAVLVHRLHDLVGRKVSAR
jgi:hypothetical protein